MTESPHDASLIASAMRLADVLQTENAALAMLNMTAAARLLPEKLAAADAFAAARAGAQDRPAGADEREFASLANRLQSLSVENRRLLERAMLVQSRVIATVARAARAAAERAAMPAYGARSTPRSEACAVATRA